MNPCLILTKNNLDLTKRCIESVLAQDIAVKIHVYDNESTDGTQNWLESQPEIIDQSSGVDLGVSAAWNFVLDILFSTNGNESQGWHADHVLVLNNDVVLPKTFYRELLEYHLSFVTGVATDNMTEMLAHHGPCPLSPHPDFSAFLIRSEAWKAVGPFDERFVLYCQDCAMHIEAHKKGVPLWKANVPYFHVNSQTLKRANPEERTKINEQANKDRETFKSIYGCLPGTKEYEALFRA